MSEDEANRIAHLQEHIRQKELNEKTFGRLVDNDL